MKVIDELYMYYELDKNMKVCVFDRNHNWLYACAVKVSNIINQYETYPEMFNWWFDDLESSSRLNGGNVIITSSVWRY